MSHWLLVAPFKVGWFCILNIQSRLLYFIMFFLSYFHPSIHPLQLPLLLLGLLEPLSCHGVKVCLNPLHFLADSHWKMYNTFYWRSLQTPTVNWVVPFGIICMLSKSERKPQNSHRTHTETKHRKAPVRNQTHDLVTVRWQREPLLPSTVMC